MPTRITKDGEPRDQQSQDLIGDQQIIIERLETVRGRSPATLFNSRDMDRDLMQQLNWMQSNSSLERWNPPPTTQTSSMDDSTVRYIVRRLDSDLRRQAAAPKAIEESKKHGASN